MIPDVVTILRNNVVITQPAGSEILVAMAVAASAANGDRAEAALAAISDIAAEAPDAPSVLNKLDASSLNSLKDQPFYGVGNGVADDTAAVLAANAAGGVVYVPEGRFDTTLSFYDLVNARFTGEGPVVLDGYAQARRRSFLTTEVEDSSYDRTRIFDALTEKAHAAEYMFVGPAVGAADITEYRNLNSAASQMRVYDFNGGRNMDPGDHALGRTGASMDFLGLYHGGHGDLSIWKFYGEAFTPLGDEVHILARPALGMLSGGFSAVGAAYGVYLQPDGEMVTSDAALTPGAGAGIAVGGSVRNYHRYFDGASRGEAWFHDRAQAAGPLPMDVAYNPAGLFERGFDTAAASFTDGAAFVSPAGHYRYMDATSTPDSLGIIFYSDDLGETFDGMVGDTYTISLGTGKKYQISGLQVCADDAAASVAGVEVGEYYLRTATQALTQRFI